MDAAAAASPPSAALVQHQPVIPPLQAVSGALGETQRGKPPPALGVGFIVAAQWVMFAAAALNILLW